MQASTSEDISKKIGNVENLDAIRQHAVAYLRKEQDADLLAFGVKFDVYYLESSLLHRRQRSRKCERPDQERQGFREGRRRSGCAPPTTATTRTGGAPSPTAATPISSPTSPTT